MPKKLSSIYLPITGNPPKPRRPPARPRGPAEFARLVGDQGGFPLEVPADFPGADLASGKGQVSLDEYWMYLAFAIAFNDPPRPLKPPYKGGMSWSYQVPVLLRNQIVPREAGGDIVDFVLYLAAAKWAVRLQSELHVFDVFGGGAKQRARDLFSAGHIQGYEKIIDIYSQNFMWDRTGQAAIMTAKDCMRGEAQPNPVIFGTARRVRPPR